MKFLITIFKYILLIMLLQGEESCPKFLSPLSPSPLHPPTLQHSSQGLKGSCLRVVLVSSLASPFPTLFLTFPLSILCLPTMLLIPCIFPPILPLPTDNPLCDLHFCDSLPVLVVCSFFLFFRFSFW